MLTCRKNNYRIKSKDLIGTTAVSSFFTTSIQSETVMPIVHTADADKTRLSLSASVVLTGFKVTICRHSHSR